MFRYLLHSIILLCVAVPAGAVSLDLDYATFADLRGDTSHSYVELYARIDRWSLVTHTEYTERKYGIIQDRPDTVLIGFTADIAVLDAAGDTVHSERHIVDQPAEKSYTGTAYDDVYTTWAFYLPPGEYSAAVDVSDHYGERTDRVELPLSVGDYTGSAPSLSNLELAMGVARDTTGSRFAKNGLTVLPNVRRVFGYGAPTLYFYTEIYHLDPVNAYTLGARFVNDADEVFRTLGPFPVDPSAGTGVQVKGVNVMGFPDGEYRLRATLTEGGGTVLSERERSFTVRRTPYVSRIVAEQFRSDVGWIASRDELKEFDELGPEEKAVFITQFWEQRDPTPETFVNEFRLEHYRRLAFADQYFTDVGRPGRDSDMGRVYVRYGPPSDVERHNSTVDRKEYQIWKYANIQGRPEFIFVDTAGTGDLTLVHSTASGEAFNPTWESLVQPYQGTLTRQGKLGREDDDNGFRPTLNGGR